MATISVLVTNILQSILFCVQQKKESHTGLEQLEGEQVTEFSFLGELTSLRLVCVSCLFINNFDCLSVAILGFIDYLIFDSCSRLFKRHQLNCKLNNFCTCRFWSTSNPVKTRSHVDECKW